MNKLIYLVGDFDSTVNDILNDKSFEGCGLTKENVEMKDYKENRFLFYSLFTAGGVVVGVSVTLLVVYLAGGFK